MTILQDRQPACVIVDRRYIYTRYHGLTPDTCTITIEHSGDEMIVIDKSLIEGLRHMGIIRENIAMKELRDVRAELRMLDKLIAAEALTALAA